METLYSCNWNMLQPVHTLEDLGDLLQICCICYYKRQSRGTLQFLPHILFLKQTISPQGLQTCQVRVSKGLQRTVNWAHSGRGQQI